MILNANLISKLSARLDMNAVDLASKAKLSLRTVYRVLHGDDVNLSTIVAVGNALGVDYRDLLCVDGKTSMHNAHLIPLLKA